MGPEALDPALDGVDFIDLGASKGGSLRYCSRRFGGRGLGIDIDPGKVAATRGEGFDVVCADATALNVHKAVRYVAAMDFFEHLPDVDTTRLILRSAAEAATDFIFVRHPSFEGEHYLRQMGLCQYWHEWSGHTNHLRISDFCGLFAELDLHAYTIEYIERVGCSSHPSVLPLGFRNHHEYDPERHGAKNDVPLPESIWRMQHIYVALRELPASTWRAIVRG